MSSDGDDDENVEGEEGLHEGSNLESLENAFSKESWCGMEGNLMIVEEVSIGRVVAKIVCARLIACERVGLAWKQHTEIFPTRGESGARSGARSARVSARIAGV